MVGMSGRRLSNLTPGERTVARLDSGSWRRFTTDVSGAGWFRLGDRLRDPAAMDTWYRDERDGPARGHRDLAGALIAYRFAGSLAALVTGPLLGQRRVLVLGPDDVWLRLVDGTSIGEVGVPAPTVVALAADTEAEADVEPGGAGGRVVDDIGGLCDVATDSLHAVFAPLADAVRARAPFGRSGMWGTLADHVAETALDWARSHGDDPEAAWSAAAAVVDGLGEREPALRARPRRHPVDDQVFADKGTCCLVYKVHDPAPPGPATNRRRIAQAACASCPLRAADDRHDRFARYLRSLRPGGRPG